MVFDRNKNSYNYETFLDFQGKKMNTDKDTGWIRHRSESPSCSATKDIESILFFKVLSCKDVADSRNGGALSVGRGIGMAVTPADAATVILLRQGNGEGQGFEVLMALRNSRSAFVPGSYVFPGGRVEEKDCLRDMENFCDGPDLTRAQGALDGVSLSERGLAIWIAAIRETFEEVGILFACQRDGTLLSFDPDDIDRRFLSYRERVHGGELDFTEVLRMEELTLALDRLHYFSHWITPELSPIRYDTRFFVAEVPPDQEALHDGDELTKHLWITPAEALEGYRQQILHMVIPTIVTLEELCCFETIGDVLQSTRGKDITGVLTRMVLEGGEIQEHAPDGRIFRNLVPPR